MLAQGNRALTRNLACVNKINLWGGWSGGGIWWTLPRKVIGSLGLLLKEMYASKNFVCVFLTQSVSSMCFSHVDSGAKKQAGRGWHRHFRQAFTVKFWLPPFLFDSGQSSHVYFLSLQFLPRKTFSSHDEGDHR